MLLKRPVPWKKLAAGALGVLLVSVAAVLAHLHVASQTYYPVVRIASSSTGLKFIAVQNAVSDRRDCGIANDRMVNPMRDLCRECEIVTARCERELTGIELALSENAAVPHYRVVSPGIRLAIKGPVQPAKDLCTVVAGGLVRQGHRAAACVAPSS